MFDPRSSRFVPSRRSPVGETELHEESLDFHPRFFPVFEEKREYFATSVLSESVNLQFDTEGRVSLTEKLLNTI